MIFVRPDVLLRLKNMSFFNLQSSGGCRSASSAGVGAVTVANAGAGAGGACAARMASAGAQYRGGTQQWATAYAPQPCRYPPPQAQPQPYATPYTPHQVY